MEYEWTATLETGWNLTTGERWSGHRVRYRAKGARFYRSFLLSVYPEQVPSEAQILQAIQAHAAGSAAKASS